MVTSSPFFLLSILSLLVIVCLTGLVVGSRHGLIAGVVAGIIAALVFYVLFTGKL